MTLTTVMTLVLAINFSFAYEWAYEINVNGINVLHRKFIHKSVQGRVVFHGIMVRALVFGFSGYDFDYYAVEQ